MHILIRSAHAALLVGSALATACAPALPRPDAITRLEAQRERQPEAAPVHRSLGIALYRADRIPEARASLEMAMRLDPRDGTTALYLGLAAERQGDFAAAREAYSSYLRHGRTRRLRSQLESRLAALQHREIEAAARTAVASEASIGEVAGNPRVVAVMPFRFAGADSTLRPLERGFAELVTTDLARSRELTVVERARLQAVVDELALQGSGATDSTSNVRAGRLLRAGRIVQGALLQVGREQLRVDAAVVDVPTRQAVGTASGDDRLDALFDLEKRLVLDLFAELGVQLTVAERRAIEQRPTRSLAAFLSYSRGLLAEDAGDFDAASRHFQNAYRIDPGFGAAAARASDAERVAAAQQVTTAEVEAQTAGTTEGRVADAAEQGAVGAAISSTVATVTALVNDVNPTQAGAAVAVTAVGGILPLNPLTPGRDGAAEGTGNDNPLRSAKLIIVIPIPGVTGGIQ